MFEEIFKKRKLLSPKLLEYGFKQKDGKFEYRTDVMGFWLLIIIDKEGKVDTILTDKETSEEYALYKTNASGAYVGKIREAIEEILNDIATKCYRISVFKEAQTLRIIDFVFKKYGDSLEFLWTKFPDNAIWRRKDTNKWYGAILTIKKNKLGLDSEKIVEIIDLRIEPSEMETLLKSEHYYPGWHMNKKNWFSAILDESISDEELFGRIQRSYELAVK